MNSKAKLKVKHDNFQKDLIAKGFKKLDSNLISQKPPKIKWGKLYGGFNDKEKIEYLEKLASTMNHAAYLIQEERNGLLKLIDKKEDMVERAKKAMDENNEMVQIELNKVNKERQKANANGQSLKGDAIRAYLKKHGNNS